MDCFRAPPVVTQWTQRLRMGEGSSDDSRKSDGHAQSYASQCSLILKLQCVVVGDEHLPRPGDGVPSSGAYKFFDVIVRRSGSMG